MARQRDYKAEYAARVKNAPRGSYARQVARGHREPPGQEHRVRAARARAAGRLTEPELAFLRKQQAKDPGMWLSPGTPGSINIPDLPRQRRAQALFEAMSPAERARIMDMQRRMHRRYRAQHGKPAPAHFAGPRGSYRDEDFYDEADDEHDTDIALLLFYHSP